LTSVFPSASPIIIENSQFILSKGKLGALGIERRNGIVDFISCNFSQNTATNPFDGGGALYLREVDQPKIKNSFFSRNEASNYGGAIYCYHGTGISQVNIESSEISGNNAGLDGGGIFAYNSNVNLTNATFEGNTAGRSGGGLCENILIENI